MKHTLHLTDGTAVTLDGSRISAGRTILRKADIGDGQQLFLYAADNGAPVGAVWADSAESVPAEMTGLGWFDRVADVPPGRAVRVSLEPLRDFDLLLSFAFARGAEWADLVF